MKKLFRQHPETILTILALVFLGLIAASFSWGSGMVAAEVNRAMNSAIVPNPGVMFNLKDAQSLNLRGLVKVATGTVE